jgi:hypothetical protein
MLPIGFKQSIRLLLAVTATMTLVPAQQPREGEREKQHEGARQGGAQRNAAAPGDQAARPQRQAAPAAAPAAQSAAPAANRPARTVSGAYTPPAVAPTPAPVAQHPSNPGGFNRNPNPPADAQQTRNPGGFDRNANRPADQQPRNPAGFDRNSSRPTDRNINASRPPDQRYNPSPNRDARASSRPDITRNSAGRVESYRSRSGAEVRYRPDGRVGAIHSGNMTIHSGAGNSRRIVVQRNDRTMIVTNRSGHGFVQRPFAYRGSEFVNRTYYLRGQAYSRYYRPYSYRGMMLNSYVPTRYYHSNFYGWFNRPWAAPVSFAWGWMGASWYGYYRGYFNPYPYYSSPTYWLTDYMISARLAEDYNDRQGAPPLYGAVMMSPAVKQAIAIEVERQLAVERADADALARNEIPDPQAGFPRLLSDGNPHVFIVSYNLDVTESSGAGCTVSRGDVLRLASPPPPSSPSAYLEVVAAKPGSCRVGSLVAVGLEDLQDIYNQMRESLSQGVDELRSKAGMNGLPALPAGYAAPAQTASFVQAAPPPDVQVANELQQEVQAANSLEQQATNEATEAQRDPGGAPAPATIALGQSTDQVIALLGNPKQVINLGTKQIFVYDRLKVTFLAGKVSDVE